MTSRKLIPTGLIRALWLAAALLAPWPAIASEAQNPDDRGDASVLSEEATERSPLQQSATPETAVARSGERDVMTSLRPFVAGAIRVEGATALPPAAFAAAIEPYLGRALTAQELASLARDVGNVARRAGYGLATAWVPQQQVANGVLRVRIDEGRIDAIEASGPAGPAAERLLRRLAGGAPVRTADLERQLLLAGDLAGVTLGQARLVRSGNRNILRVETSVRKVDGRFGLDNWGTSVVGPVRARVSADVNGIATLGDQLSLGAMVTVPQAGEFQLVQAGYSVPVGSDGTRISARAYLSFSRAGGAFRDQDLEGRSFEFEAGLSHPLIRSRAASLWGQLELGLRDSRLTREDVRAREDRITAISASFYGWTRAGGGTGRVRLALAQGLSALGATRPGDPLASRSDADGTFSKISFWGDYTKPLGKRFSFQVSGEGQLASGPLLASEELGLGGRTFLRGYDYREFSGDRGAAAAAELRFDLRDLPRPVRAAQLYVYGDAGRVTNQNGGTGGGSLASAGGGVRLWLHNRLEAGLELGVPVSDGALGRRPAPRLSFTLGGRF